VKTRTALLLAVVASSAFVATEIWLRKAPTQTPSTSSPIHVAQNVDPGVEVKEEPVLPTDPAAKQRAIDVELNRAIKRELDIEVNRAIERALSDAQYDRKHRSDR
jgi:hypothetical protein